MTTTTEKELLETLFSEASYEAVRQSGLYKLIENSEWDRLGEEFGAAAQKLVNELIKARMVEILEEKMSETSHILPSVEEMKREAA